MPTYYVKKTAGEKPKSEENWLVWFSDKGIEGCNNALLLYGSGEIHLLRTVRVVGRDELDGLNIEDWTSKDYGRWEEIFGTGSASNELREAFRSFRQLNIQKKIR